MSHFKNSGGLETEEFCGNFILSFRFIVLCIWEVCFIGGLVLGLKSQISAPGISGLVILMPVFLFLYGAQLCYFRLTDDSLEIRNHIFRFYCAKYKLTTIKSLTFRGSEFRTSRSLRVRSAGSGSWKYYAGSLRDKDWEEFGDAMRKRGIPVNNE